MIPRNSTPVKNKVLIEVFAKGRLTQTEMRIASYIMRWSWGFDEGSRRQEWTREISITKMSEEIEMDRGNCSKTVKKMLEDGKLFKRGRRYRFNERYEEWGKVVKITTNEGQGKVVKSTTPTEPEKVVKSTTKSCKNYNKKLLNLQLTHRAKQGTASPPPALKETYKETLKKSTTEANEKLKLEGKGLKAEKAEAVIKTQGKGEKPEKIAFDPASGRLSHLSPEFVKRLKEAFPRSNVEEEIRKAELWLYANPAKRKSNYERFLINWLSRAKKASAVKAEGGRSGKNGRYIAVSNAPRESRADGGAPFAARAGEW